MTHAPNIFKHHGQKTLKLVPNFPFACHCSTGIEMCVYMDLQKKNELLNRQMHETHLILKRMTLHLTVISMLLLLPAGEALDNFKCSCYIIA